MVCQKANTNPSLGYFCCDPICVCAICHSLYLVATSHPRQARPSWAPLLTPSQEVGLNAEPSYPGLRHPDFSSQPWLIFIHTAMEKGFFCKAVV